MHLKNLTLKGFKSFADTASIDLEPGVTVVVGPNGSGKSNVVDAIAWVLDLFARLMYAIRGFKWKTSEDTFSIQAVGMSWIDIVVDDSAARKALGYETVVTQAQVRALFLMT